MLGVEREKTFELLVDNVSRCDLCERMLGRPKILSNQNGDIDAPILFVGEAPGRLGADRTLIPFHGDQAGRNFERLLSAAGLSRKEAFITNAVICNPRNGQGNNATPTAREVRNCSLHLSLLLNIIHPEIVVTLGQTALAALNEISPHSMVLRKHVRRPVSWMNYTVLPSYHPGTRALVHRSLSNQIADFYVIGELLGRDMSRHRKAAESQGRLIEVVEPRLLHSMVLHMVKRLGPVSKFKLTKLLYLLDWHEVRASQGVLTGCYYIFQKEGPLATGLSRVLDEMNDHELRCHFSRGMPVYESGPAPRFGVDLSGDLMQKADVILDRYGASTEGRLKTITYLTKPVKDLLRRRAVGEQILNASVFQDWLETNSPPH